MAERLAEKANGGRGRRRGHGRRTPWWLHSKLHPARRIALILVAVFDIVEVALLARRGFESHNVIPLLLGFAVLLLLLGFELYENAAIRRERELAHEIAEWLTPRVPPSIPHLEIAFSSHRVERVASDYFNISPRWPYSQGGDGHHVFVAMADVAGLGVQGALLMATFQASLRALADTRMSLGELAQQMNRWSWDRSLDGRHFVMGFFADLQPESGELRYVNAGHQPPVLVRADGAIESLELRGFPLGVMDHSDYEIGSAAMAAGDALVIVTDGATAAVDHRGEPFGEERLRRSVANARGFGASELLDQVLTSVLAFAGSAKQQDDLTVLVVRRTG